MKAEDRRYTVTTWDMDEESFTRQLGMIEPWENLTIWQLKAALKELRTMGYDCHYLRDKNGNHDANDFSVCVEWVNEPCVSPAE